MIRKSIITGVIVGLLLTLAALYPTLTIVSMLRVLPFKVLWGSGNVLHLVLLMVSGGATTLISLAIGSVAAWRAGATIFKKGLYAGALSGLAASFVLYVMLIAPTISVVSAGNLFQFPYSLEQPQFPDAMVVAFAQNTVMGNYDVFVFLVGLVIGGLQGGIVGWLRRHAPSSSRPSSLLEAIEGRRSRRTWFTAYDDEALKAGLLVGFVGGMVLVLMNLSTSLSEHEMSGVILQQATSGFPLGRLLTGRALPAVLAPLVLLVVAGIGGVAAFLPKNPPGRIGARVYAAIVAGTMVGLMVSVQGMLWIHFGIGLLPQLVHPMLDAPGLEMGTNWPGGFDAVIKMLEIVTSASLVRKLMVSALSTPQVRVVLMYLLPFPFMVLVVMFWTIWSTLQGMFYSPIFMLFKLRPVDRARAVRRDIVQHDDKFLLRLYRLFQTDRHAVQVLEHLAFDLVKKSDPVKARVVAAYHVLATQPGLAARALDVISSTLTGQPDWKLRTEIMTLHDIMAQGLHAGTVAQIAAISPMPEDQTSSLPPPLAKAGKHLSRILNELKKIERVDDLSSKIIFLNNTLENLRLARIFVEEGAKDACNCTIFPEFIVLRTLLDHWEEIVLSTVKDKRGRAKLTAELKTCKLTRAPKLVLSIVLANHGLNVAEDVRLEVVDCEKETYKVLDGKQQQVDILSPQDSRELSFTIKPLGEDHKVRLCWKVTYDDALSDDRVLEFGDMVEFVEAEKPFQRIFPIPYVTGTPLQSGEMFVGREDVFKFVRDNLLGTYQNNVIVLHGQRRTGKTSVLYRLGEVLADTHVCVLIDMQGKAARGEVDFLYSIADDIAYALENKDIFVDLPERKDFEESPEFFFRSRFLRNVYKALEDRSLLLMFDEFEELQKRVEDGKLTADIFPYFRNLMQHERKVDFVFAGTHKLEELAAEYWSILFNIAAYKRITFLEEDEVTRLVTQPVAPYGLEYDPLAVERIYQVTAGHPYFTQLVCHELVAYHNETKRSYLTTTDVNLSLERIVERGEAHFKYIWAESSTQQRLALLALAELLEADEAATSDDVCGLLYKRGRPLDDHELPQALVGLESRDILMRSGPRSNLYRFRVDLIRRWIYAARPAYEKVV